MAGMKRVLYCGGRDWTDRQMVKRVMVAGFAANGFHVVIHGAAPGADTQVNLVALGLGLQREIYPAKWKTYGRAAGPIRNQEMLDSGVDMVVAFKDGFNRKMDKGGTEDMIRRSILAGLPCVLYSHDLGEAHWLGSNTDEAQAPAPRVQRRDEGGGQATLW